MKVQKSSSLNLLPPLKWAGGKRWLIQHLAQLTHQWQPFQHCRWVEPFVGGMAAALGLRPQQALLNDINPYLITFYRCLQQGFQIHLPLQNDEKMYYHYRLHFNQLIRTHGAECEKIAALFYYMNRTGYNGLCRFNRQGEFNVPYGKYKKINYIKDFTPYQTALSEWTFNQADFAQLTLQPTDFIYADPPYDTSFTQYAQEGFDWYDQERLAKWLVDHKGPTLVSNRATPRIVELYTDLGFSLHFLQAPRRISCNGNRAAVKEILAIRNIPLHNI